MNPEERDLTVARLLSQERYDFNDLVSIMAILRLPGGCLWDKEQTHESIRDNLIEETYEVIEAIDNQDIPLMREELGDALLQVVFHARIEEEAGNFNIDDVANDICAKLIHRHPHVFGSVVAHTTEEMLANWERIKSEEKQRETLVSRLEAIPPHLPALMRASKIVKKTAFWDPDENSVAAEESTTVYEDISMLTAVIEAMEKEGHTEDCEDILGALLYAVTILSRKLSLSAEAALTHYLNDRINYFRACESLANGRSLEEMSKEERNALRERLNAMQDEE